MASLKEMRDNARNEFFANFCKTLEEQGEDVLVTKSNTFAFPILLEDGTEDYIRVIVSIPTGTKDDPYDPYTEAEMYKEALADKRAKAEKKAKEKAEKVARDKAKRKKAKATHE